ncbi:MAG TPA: sigma-E processing peptidase SpoIIGA [Candidatus Pullilachnospira intestinigallinarum]|nr:sigma-E processing peptidase SpoIIGA [Candidatus Pullilachnospira intestinigallinarum]
MYYEVFIDVLFVMNFVMDYFLLRLTCRLLGHSATWRRSLAGAAIGAAGICLPAIVPAGRLLNTILIHVVVNTIMVRFGCNLKKWREIAQGVLVLYGAGFLLGGMLLMLQRATGSRGVRAFFLLGTVSYMLLAAGIRVCSRAKRKRARIYRVWLYANGKCYEGFGLYDTGNQLWDPVCQKPVSIGDAVILNELFPSGVCQELRKFGEGEKPDNDALLCSLRPHFLPFRSVGCSRGTALAVTLDYLCVEGHKVHKVITRPVIAFSRESSSISGDYQVILHPNLIDS